jgi:hypothetical protein
MYEDASAGTPPGLRWFWSVTAIVPAIPNATNGTAVDAARGEDEVGKRG